MLADPIPAKSHPARVNGTHGAGVLTPSGFCALGGWVIISYRGSSELTGSVQYVKADFVAVPDERFGSRYEKVFAAPRPFSEG
jgi:hypothetical protein